MGCNIAERIRVIQENHLSMPRENNTQPVSVALALTFAASALAGFACVVVPAYVLQNENNPIPLWPIGKVVERIRFLPSFIGLFVTGLACGYWQPRYWHLLGLSTVALLPAVAIIEMLLDPKSHNLWPIEFIIYGLYAIPGFLGAAITGVVIRHLMKRIE